MNTARPSPSSSCGCGCPTCRSDTARQRAPLAAESETGPADRVSGRVRGKVTQLIRAGREIAAITEAIREGHKDPRTLTNLVFFARHPERTGRRIQRHERELAQEWLRIRDVLVRPMLARLAAPTAPSSRVPPPVVSRPSSPPPGVEGRIPSLGGPRVPPGYRQTRAGLARTSNVRLDAKLVAMRKAGAIVITDRDLDTLQRIANVESNGMIQALNTWDSGVVSLGFMQWTILWGSLQRWIRRAPKGFLRYGIAVDGVRKWAFRRKNQQPAIAGASTPDDLRWNGWAQRFYLAGLDDELIAVEVQLALEVLAEKLERMRRKLDPSQYALFARHYDQSAELRAIFQEAYNNRPVAAIEATRQVVRSTTGGDTREFLARYKRAIGAAFLNQGKSADHLLARVGEGMRLAG